jgi:hypothetical protein
MVAVRYRRFFLMGIPFAQLPLNAILSIASKERRFAYLNVRQQTGRRIPVGNGGSWAFSVWQLFVPKSDDRV